MDGILRRDCVAGMGKGDGGGALAARWALITPALFSRPSTRPSGEKREWLVKNREVAQDAVLLEPLSPRQGWVEGRERGVGE
jgi:hypothetical protein